MRHRKVNMVGFVLFFCLVFVSFSTQASGLTRYITLEAENGYLEGAGLRIIESPDQDYIFSEGKGKKYLSFNLNIPRENTFDFWIRVRGDGRGTLKLYNSGKKVLKEKFSFNNNRWQWIKVSREIHLQEDGYFLVLDKFSGRIQLDKIVVKNSDDKGINNQDNNFTIMSAGPSEPTLPDQSPWAKQGLNPFATLLKNGQEYVSPISGTLSVNLTDFVVPGRGGLDLQFGRKYSSSTTSHDSNKSPYFLKGGWEVSLPFIFRDEVHYSNGSVCDLTDDEVTKDVEELDNGDVKKTYTTGVNRYFKLIEYGTYEPEETPDGTINKYVPVYYDLYLADGRHLHFSGKGAIEYVESANGSNRISYEYTDGELSRIVDTIGRGYTIQKYSDRIEIIREYDNQILVTYNFASNGRIDSYGSLISVIDADGRITKYTYGTGGLTDIEYPSGKISRYSYNLESYEKPNFTWRVYWLTGQKIYHKDNAGKEILIKRTDYSYDFKDKEKRDIRYTTVTNYDSMNNPQLTTYYHGNSNNLTERKKVVDETTNKVIRTVFFGYDTHRNKLAETIYEGNIHDSNYDDAISHSAVSNEQRQRLDDYLISIEHWRYDSWANMVYHRDPEGYETAISYVNTDSESQFQIVGDNNYDISTAFYDNSSVPGHIFNLPSGKLKVRKYSGLNNEQIEGSETYFGYDSNGNMIEEKSLAYDEKKNPSWIKTDYSNYDQYGNCGQIIHYAGTADAITIDYEYSSQYNYAYLTAMTQQISSNLVDGDGNPILPTTATTSYEYDYKTGNKTKVIDPVGNMVTYEYDVLGRPTKITYPLTIDETEAATEEVIYDDENNLVQVYDAKKEEKMVHYFDGLGRETKVERYDLTDTGEILHSTTTTDYNWQNKKIRLTDQNGKTTTYQYDVLGRPLKITTADGNVTTREYDDLNRKITITKPDNNREIVYQDRKGQKIKRVLEKGMENLTYHYQYDGFGNLIKTIDAKNQEMGYVYNNNGQLIETRYPDSAGKVYDQHSSALTEFNYYDTKGNLTKTTDRKGQIIYYDYNEYNQVIKQDLPTSPDIDYYYNKIGQLIKVSQGNEFEKLFSYDARGRLIEQKLIVNPELADEKVYTTGYDYDQNRNLTNISYPAGMGNLSYGYDELDRLDLVQWQGSNLVNNINYNMTDHMSSISYGNSVSGQYGYGYINGQYMPRNITYRQNGNHLGVYDYRYDLMGNMTRANNHRYQYDDLGQLTGWEFFKDNDQVLLGEETLLDKEMIDQTGLQLDQTMVNDDSLKLALAPYGKVSNLARLRSSGQVSAISGLTKDHSNDYRIYRQPYNYKNSFTDANSINGTKTSAKVDYSTGVVTLPEKQSWQTIFSQSPNLELTRNDVRSISTYLAAYYSGTSYSSYSDYTSSTPSLNDSSWAPANGSLALNNVKNIKKIKFAAKASLVNSWRIWGGWGNWSLWIKIETDDGVHLGLIEFPVDTAYSQTRTENLTVDLSNCGMEDRDYLNVKMYYLITKYGEGSTKGGTIRELKATAVEEYCYPTNSLKARYYDSDNYPDLRLKEGVNYKFDVDQYTPSDTTTNTDLYRTYTAYVPDPEPGDPIVILPPQDPIISSTDTGSITTMGYETNTYLLNALSSGETFTVPGNDRYQLRLGVKTLDEDKTPKIRSVKISEEMPYPDDATIQLNSINLPYPCTKLEFTADENKPSGTSIDYKVSNNGGSSYKLVTYNSSSGRYEVDFNSPGNQIIFKAILKTENQKVTPQLSGVDITIPDAYDYQATGNLTTSQWTTTQTAQALYLELHSKENGGDIRVSLLTDGQEIIGQPVAIKELIAGIDEEELGRVGDSKISDPNINPNIIVTLEDKAQNLRLETSNRELEYNYYRFELPDEMTGAPITGQFKITLDASSDRKSSPNIYSYILFIDKMYHHQAGTFETVNPITAKGNYTFDKARIDITETKPANTSTTYSLSELETGQTMSATPGQPISLGVETDSLKLGGSLNTTYVQSSPQISRMKVTAIGETPFKKDLEVNADLSTSLTDTISQASDRISGDYAVKIDHTGVGYGEYRVNSEVFDASKLPFVQLWVKPLSDRPISFAGYDITAGSYERINSDRDGDSYFEIGEDLIKDEWNLVLLDLRKTTSGGITGDAKNLKIIVDYQDTKLLVDAIDSLPLNQANYSYDQVGNRTEYEENGVITRYEYQLGSNRLLRRYNVNEEVNYSYDDNGNLTRQEVNDYQSQEYYYYDYEYNEMNQMTEVRKNDILLARYQYDEKGLRYKKIDYLTDKTTIYIYGQGTEPIYEEIYSNSDMTTPLHKTSYLFMGSKRIAKDDNGTISYYYADHLGSTRIMMDNTGNCDYYEYKPFGGDFRPGKGERYKFTGKEDEGTIGLQYFNARYYDPAVGRFISEDPAKDGVNWFVYTANNPLIFNDSDGKRRALASNKFKHVFVEEDFNKNGLLKNVITIGFSYATRNAHWSANTVGSILKNGLAKQGKRKFTLAPGDQYLAVGTLYKLEPQDHLDNLEMPNQASFAIQVDETIQWSDTWEDLKSKPRLYYLSPQMELIGSEDIKWRNLSHFLDWFDYVFKQGKYHKYDNLGIKNDAEEEEISKCPEEKY